MHFIAAKLSVTDDRKLSRAAFPVCAALGRSVLLFQGLAGEMIDCFEHHFGEVAEVMADLIGVNLLRQFGAGDDQRLFALE